MPMTLTVPLDLPDVRVLAYRMLENGTVLMEVESTLRTAQCHRCGREIDRFHQGGWKLRQRDHVSPLWPGNRPVSRV